jgi:hypothetical protein
MSSDPAVGALNVSADQHREGFYMEYVGQYQSFIREQPLSVHDRRRSPHHRSAGGSVVRVRSQHLSPHAVRRRRPLGVSLPPLRVGLDQLDGDHV